jgi:hypothetical protein
MFGALNEQASANRIEDQVTLLHVHYLSLDTFDSSLQSENL